MPEIRNPNQGGGQDSRSFLVMMIVMVGVIFGVQYWQAKRLPPPKPAPTTQAAAPASSAPLPSPTPSAATPAAAVHATSSSAAQPTVIAAAATTLTVENELYRITLSNHGGQVISWVLKRYKDEDGKPLDLVDHAAAERFGFPLSLYTYDPALTAGLASALYVTTANGAPVTASTTLQAPVTLHFRYAANGYDVTKTFTFGEDYVIHADSQVLYNGNPIRALLAWPSGLGDTEKPRTHLGRGSYTGDTTVDTLSAGHDDHIASKKVIGGATLNGDYSFAGVSDQYFAATFLPTHPQDATLATLHHELDLNDILRANHQPENKKAVMLPIIGAGVGSLSGHDELSLFVGPKAIDVLKSIHTADGHTLEPILDFGFWGPIGKYLFLGLRAVHSMLPNALLPTSTPGNQSWGWAIIVFTIFLNLLLLPLRVQSMRSALKMQRIQPQIDAIKAKYKNPKATDPKMAEMNAEIMETQKANGVSMFGGCIPALVQFPLLFAFFTMMTRVVELRQAHFFWLPDLSQADPLHILPIVMVITSFLVQYYTPSPGVDPQQQKMMAFMMPLFSGFFTWNYASGLALYWNIGNFVMIIQQAVMNRTSLGREMREIAARRARQKLAARSGTAKPVPKTVQARR